MSLESSQPISQADLTRLDQFLRTNACGHETMGLSYAHGFLCAIASAPERLKSDEWLRLVFKESVFHSGKQAEEMLILTLRLFKEIDHRLKTNVGFYPVFDQVQDTQNKTYADAQPWCLGFTAGLKLFSDNWTDDANVTLQTPLSLLFKLSDMPGIPDPTYAKLCDAVPDATEYIYTYWQSVAHQ